MDHYKIPVLVVLFTIVNKRIFEFVDCCFSSVFRIHHKIFKNIVRVLINVIYSVDIRYGVSIANDLERFNWIGFGCTSCRI